MLCCTLDIEILFLVSTGIRKFVYFITRFNFGAQKQLEIYSWMWEKMQVIIYYLRNNYMNKVEIYWFCKNINIRQQLQLYFPIWNSRVKLQLNCMGSLVHSFASYNLQSDYTHTHTLAYCYHAPTTWLEFRNLATIPHIWTKKSCPQKHIMVRIKSNRSRERERCPKSYPTIIITDFL